MAILGGRESEDGRVSEGPLGIIFFLVFWASKWCPGFLLTPPRFRSRDPQKPAKNFLWGIHRGTFLGSEKNFRPNLLQGVFGGQKDVAESFVPSRPREGGFWAPFLRPSQPIWPDQAPNRPKFGAKTMLPCTRGAETFTRELDARKNPLVKVSGAKTFKYGKSGKTRFATLLENPVHGQPKTLKWRENGGRRIWLKLAPGVIWGQKRRW